jgi:hypothetical protein
MCNAHPQGFHRASCPKRSVRVLPVTLAVPTMTDRVRASRHMQPKRIRVMTSTTKLASLTAGLLFLCGASSVARANIPSSYTLQPGTVLSTHTPETNACPISLWQLWIEPHDTVRGSIGEWGTGKAWRLAGTYDSHGTFHLNGQELNGSASTGTVDAQVQSDGSLSLRMTNLDPSQCYNRTIYLPWFRNGNDFNPFPQGGDGSR